MRPNMRALTATVAIASVAPLAIGTVTAHGAEYLDDISLAFQTVLQNHTSPLYNYPTDLTREVVPVKRPSLLFSPATSSEQAITMTESNPFPQ